MAKKSETKPKIKPRDKETIGLISNLADGIVAAAKGGRELSIDIPSPKSRPTSTTASLEKSS